MAAASFSSSQVAAVQRSVQTSSSSSTNRPSRRTPNPGLNSPPRQDQTPHQRAMASPRMAFALLLSLSLLLPSSRGSPVRCEELPQDLCAFAVSTASKRCVLENSPRGDGTTEYQCRTSEVVVERISDWIETDECVRACGVDRAVVGISSDNLLEPQFAAKLCSPACYQNCPNIVDLYFNLAAGEGVFLPDLCAARRSNPHRSMVELLSSGAAPGPAAAEKAVAASPMASAPVPSV